jgi:predicted tellurium resistance membrane protein TerC
VIVLRGIMIAAARPWWSKDYWLLYIVAAFLIFDTAVKMSFAGRQADGRGEQPGRSSSYLRGSCG